MDNLTTSSGRPATHPEIIEAMQRGHQSTQAALEQAAALACHHEGLTAARQTWHFPLASRISGCSRCDAFWAASEAVISELAR